MAKLTLLDIAKLNGNDTVVGLIEENLTFAPEVSIFPARQIRGTSYKTVTRTGFPSVSFRSANEGVARSKSSFTEKLIQCYILGGGIEVDKAVGMASEEGMAYLEMLEASGVMKQALIELGSQIWYGVTVDAKGFPGIKSVTPVAGATTLNSGGSNAAAQSSVYAVKFGTQDVTLITGNGTTFNLGEFRDETIYDANDLPLPGRVADLVGWAGLQVGNVNCVGRICNVGDNGETGDMLTDQKVQDLLDLFPVGYTPDRLFMSRRSRGQLQRSRTVTINQGGSTRALGNLNAIADLPTESMGIPITVTDSIGITDAVES